MVIMKVSMNPSMIVEAMMVMIMTLTMIVIVPALLLKLEKGIMALV